jgi:hypothetical protein
LKARELLPEVSIEPDAGRAARAPRAAPSFGAVAANACPSCGELLVGRYCHECGEERACERDLSLRHFAVKTLRELTDFEHSKIFRTFSTLISRPGLLTNEYLAGRRKLYLTPLKICLVVFALYLFAYSFYRPASIFDVGRIVRDDRTGKVEIVFINRQAAKKGVAPEAFIERINEQWHRYMSLLQISSVLFLAVMMQLAYLRSRRYFAEHLIFSMHFLSFAFLCGVIVWPLNLLTGMDASLARMFIIVPTLIITAAYLFFALRRVYRQPTGVTLIKTAALSLGYHLVLAMLVILTLVLAYVHVLTLDR